MRRSTCILILILSIAWLGLGLSAQTILYTMPEETATHEGTWIQWPHNYLYGPWYRDNVEQTFVSMTNALQTGENVHIIAYDSTELSYIFSLLEDEGVPVTNLDFFIHPTDDVWSRDNGPVFVYSQNNDLTILDWGFNGWGFDTPYSNCDVIPQRISEDIGIPRVDLSAMVLEGGAIEHDGNGTMMATRSSVTHSSRNPTLTEDQIEAYLTTYLGITKFIWLDGVYGQDITDMHIDGFVKFANDSIIVTMDSTDLDYWYVSASEIDIIYNATNVRGDPYRIIMVPLTQNNIVTTYGDNLGYKGSYCNYYIANDVILVPTYNDPNDMSALSIIQSIYPERTVVGIDVRNLYEYGGMIHCITQQQPVELNATGLLDSPKTPFRFLQNYPNPFNPMTTINYELEIRSGMTLTIYDIWGRIIQTIDYQSRAPGNYKTQWSGTDESGGQVAAGVYFARLQVGTYTSIVKMIYLR